MALNPWQERFEAVFLYSPEEPFPVFGDIAMCFTAMLEERSVMQEAFAADPAHHRWTCYLGAVLPWGKELVFLKIFEFAALRGVKGHFRNDCEP